MKILARNAAGLTAALAIAVLAATAFAQQRRLPEEEWYGETKRALVSHYTGKTVRARLPIPATRRGLEMMDGELRRPATQEPLSLAAQPGDELTIQSFKVTDHGIELSFNKTGAQPARSSWNPFATRKQPRLKLRFARELTSKDLTVENINRWLATAIDVNALAPASATLTAEVAPVAVARANNTPAAIEPIRQVAWLNESQSLPALPVTGELPALGADVGELTIEAADGQARIYIDDAYSGWAPRTVRLRAGVHTVSVMRDGQPIAEQRLFIPGGKASVLRVATSEAVKR